MSTKTDHPDLSPEPGWSALEPFAWRGHTRSFVSDEPEGERIRLKFYRATEPEELRAKVWFGPGSEGPPGHAHGGSIAAVLDEAMGYTAWANGHAVLAARLTVDYRRAVPLREVVRIHTRIARVEGRKVFVAATTLAADGTVHNEGEGLFVAVGLERFKSMLGER